MLEYYIESLEPCYAGDSHIDDAFADIKREELLMIILKTDPDMANIFFNFANPAKIDLTTFMSCVWNKYHRIALFGNELEQSLLYSLLSPPQGCEYPAAINQKNE